MTDLELDFERRVARLARSSGCKHASARQVLLVLLTRRASLRGEVWEAAADVLDPDGRRRLFLALCAAPEQGLEWGRA